MMRSVRSAAVLLLAVVVLGTQSGCMFKMTHRLPVNAFFNHEEVPAEHFVRFERASMKNWMLAGFVPWSRFGAKDLVEPRPHREISDLTIRTRFNWLDTVIWVVPGFAYGYYIWAPRHVEVEGTYVDGAPAVIPAERPRRHSHRRHSPRRR